MQDIQAAIRDTKMHGHPGMDHPAARLTDADVILARQLYKPYCRECGTRALARRFGVSQAAMTKAISGTSWRHIQI